MSKNPPPIPTQVTSRPSLHPEAAIDAIHLAACRSVAHIVTLRRELERAPLPDGDPQRDPGAVSRATILRHALDAAEVAASSVRVALSTLAPRRSAIERVQIDAGGAEAMLLLLSRELDRAPWDVSEGRSELIGELVADACDSTRLVRAGLGAIAERIKQ